MNINGKNIYRLGWATILLLGLQLGITHSELLLNDFGIFGFIQGVIILLLMIAYACIPLLLLTFGIRKTKVRYALYGAAFSFIGMGVLGSFWIHAYIVGEPGFNMWFILMPMMLSLAQIIGFPLGWITNRIQQAGSGYPHKVSGLLTRNVHIK